MAGKIGTALSGFLWGTVAVAGVEFLNPGELSGRGGGVGAGVG
ncbi:MAG: hypothetical protein ACOVRM_10210 [Planctomycetaceae bacterium]